MKKICKIPALQIHDGKLQIPDIFRESYNDVIAFCERNRNSYISITIEPPKKPRTTGKDSQSHCINGYIQQIAEELGEDFDVIKMFCKRRAIKRGYPTRENAMGEIEPVSEALIDTIEAGYLIDEIMAVGSEFAGITRFRGE